MRKYLTIIILPIFIIVLIGYYYSEVESASRHYPNFQLEKIAGNEDVIKDLVVKGDISFEMFGFESFRVDSEGTSYFQDEPFLKRLNGYYDYLNIENWQNEYRNFMRGKDYIPHYFSETDELLAYSSIPLDAWSLGYDEFEIDVLHKQKKEATTFSVPIPNLGEYSFIDIKYVQLIESTLYLITLNERMNQDEEVSEVDVIVHTFDIDKQELLSTDILATVPYSYAEYGYRDIHLLEDQKSEATVLLFENEISYHQEQEEELLSETVRTNRAIQYNLYTKEKVEIELTEENIGTPIAVLGNKLYLGEVEQNLLKIVAYDIEKSTIIEQVEVETAENHLSFQELYEPFVKDELFYFVPSMSVNEGTSISVIDLENLEIVFEGAISLVEPIDENQEIMVHFNQLEWSE